MEDMQLFIKYSMEKYDGTNIMVIYATAYTFEEDDENCDNQLNVSTARCYLFNPLVNSEWIENTIEFDAISGDLQYLSSSLENTYEEGCLTGLVMLIDHIETDEKYRRKGFALSMMKGILDQMAILNVELVGLIPGYYQSEDSAERKLENIMLQRFYRKSRFELIDNYTDSPVMVKLLV